TKRLHFGPSLATFRAEKRGKRDIVSVRAGRSGDRFQGCACGRPSATPGSEPSRRWREEGDLTVGVSESCATAVGKAPAFTPALGFVFSPPPEFNIDAPPGLILA
ncbi:MAG: hypothetical protein ACREJ2_04010, partial [Planctomycetota bacterium]